MRGTGSLLSCVAFAFLSATSTVQAQTAPSPSGQTPAQAQTANALAKLNAYLNQIGYAHLAKRAEAVAKLKSKGEAHARQNEVRRKIIELIGDLPKARDLVVTECGTVEEDGFRIENIAIESLPGYWVSANVYVPPGDGPFPALVLAPGHGIGKASLYAWGANFARAGIISLAFDPMGQGERLQHHDPELGTSKLEPMGEHEHANQTALLIGKHLARYWINDGLRVVDYLEKRRDVDARHIGAFGCSGGGTATAYLAAMDSRISVAAAASYITSFNELLPGNGPQDAEQTIPGFLSAGLDFADWVELAAPRPYAIVAFDRDFFPIAGARRTYEEAKRFYSLYGAPDNLQLINGSGGHCDLVPVSQQLLTFLIRNLKGPEAAVPALVQYRPKDPDELQVTATGQVSSAIGGVTVEQMIRDEATKFVRESKSLTNPTYMLELQERTSSKIRTLTAAVAQPSEIPKASTTVEQQLEGYRLERVMIESERGITLDGLIAIPTDAASALPETRPKAYPAILWMDAAPDNVTATNADFVRLAKSGHIVMAWQPRAVFGEPPPNPNQLALGQYMQPLLRSIAVGKTIIGMRIDDTLRAINWLAARPDVDQSAITIYGKGAQGMVALHAAVLDSRINQVIVENTLISYHQALQAPLHKNLSEVLIPGVLKQYDVVDLLQAIGPRVVSIVNPVNAMGLPVRVTAARNELSEALEFDQLWGWHDRIRILKRGFGDPLPIK